jgi:hypothetical protein
VTVRPGATLSRATPQPVGTHRAGRWLRAALAVALVVAGADGFLLWARGLATPVGAEQAKASFLAGRGAPAPRRARGHRLGSTATGPAATSGSTASGSTAPTPRRRSG